MHMLRLQSSSLVAAFEHVGKIKLETIGSFNRPMYLFFPAMCSV